MAFQHQPATPPSRPRAGQALLARVDRLIHALALVILTGASWAYLVYQDWAMRHMDVIDMAMPGAGPWSAGDLALVFVMWAVMMMAMMLPSVLPLVLIHRRLVTMRLPHAASSAPTAMLVAGYLSMWTAFSVVATLMQWTLHTLAFISPGMVATNRWIASALLIAAGVYQWTPMKGACLSSCASPLQFLMTRWRDGVPGAWRMGVLHGAYCIGCCWMLMTLLFVYGVMNLAWIVAIAFYVFLEKLLPPNRWFARASGLALIALGVIYAFGATVH